MNNVNISVEECRLALPNCLSFIDIVMMYFMMLFATFQDSFFNPETGLSLFLCLYSIFVSLYMYTTVQNF